MKVTTILFDLDGTLLPMVQDDFARAYISGLTKAAETRGYSPMLLGSAIMQGTVAMVKNKGEETNEAVFWNVLKNACGDSILKDAAVFDDFYATDFQKISEICGKNQKAGEIVAFLKEKGFRVALATNPLFPTVATESRIRWAGLDPADFELFTSYETSYFCKPNLKYYQALFEKLQVQPEECLMVGNDVDEDMIVAELGAKVFLLTDCLINRQNVSIETFSHGDFDKLHEYILSIM